MKTKTPKLILALTVLLSCYGFLLGGQQLVLPGICEQFGIGVLGMGTVVSAMYVASMIAPAVMGAIADRVGKKKVLVTFSILFGLGCLLAAVSAHLAVFVVAMLVIGAGYSVCESLTSALCVEVSSQDGARYINLTQGVLAIAAILSPIIMSALPRFSFGSWRLLYIICGVPLVIIGIWLSCFNFPTAVPSSEKTIFPKSLLLSPILLALITGMFLYIGMETGFGYFVEILFDGKLSGAALSAYGISAYWAGMAFSRFMYSLRPYRPRRVVRLSFLAAAITFIGLILAASGYVCIALCALVGLTYGPIWTTLVAGAAERFPQHKASATGIMSASCGLGGIVYPVIMGALADSLDIRVGFLILAASAAVGASLCFVLRKEIQTN